MDLDAIAREVKAAQDGRRRLHPLTARWPGFDAPAAYRVAGIVHAARVAEGARPVGRKIGFTNRNIWPQYGVWEPIWAHVYDRTVRHLPAGQGGCRLDGFAEPRIEPEIVLHLSAAPPVTEEAAALLGCVDWIAHGIEIVQSHFPGWKFSGPDTIADAALHATLLVGKPHPVEQLGADLADRLADFTITLACGGEMRDRGRGANVLGSPLAALAHLVAVLARQPAAAPLAAGELVTTGTLTAALPVHAGETWTTTLDGLPLPGLSVTFE